MADGIRIRRDGPRHFPRPSPSVRNQLVQENRYIDQNASIRNSAAPRPDYDRVADLFKLALFAPTTFLPEWEEWRTVADRYRIDRRRPWPVLATSSAQFIAAELGSHLELANFEAAAIEQMVAPFGGKAAIRRLRRASRVQVAMASSPDPLFLATQDVAVSSFQRATKRRRAELQRDPPASSADPSHLRLPVGFERMGQLARIRAIQESRQTEARDGRFIQGRPQANLLKQVRGRRSSRLP